MRVIPGVTGDPLGAWLARAAVRLRWISGSPRLEAEMVLAHALGVKRTSLYARSDRSLPSDVAFTAESLVRRRLRGEPMAYLVGRREFWSLDLQVTPDVLIPRPETETLVEVALEALRESPAARVLDLGTGSGAVALAIAHECPVAAVVAVDCSAPALAVARANGERLALRVDWREGDWYAAVPGERFDAIVCNPPYVGLNDAELDADVARYEPALALYAGDNGLDHLARVSAAAPVHLQPGGWLLLEHGARQAAAVRELCQRAGLQDVRSWRDASGHERVTGGRGAPG